MVATSVQRVGRAPSTAALVLVTGTTALSTDTYVAALPALRESLGTTSTAAQLTLTMCIAGMAVGQLLVGPISDARGRRRIILAATLVFAAASAICAATPTIGVMLAARLLQGGACGAAAAVGRAMVTDTWQGRSAAAKFGTLSAVSLIAPVIGPVIGGLLLAVGDWRDVFWFLGALGLVMWIAAAVGLPESLPAGRRQPGGLRALRSRAADLLSDPRFVSPVVVQCFTTAGFFIYIGGSSIVLQTDLGLTPSEYTALFSINATTMVVSSVLYRLLVVRFGAFVLRRCAIAIQTTAVLALLVVAVAGAPEHPPLPAIWICLSLMTFGLGTYLPSNAAIAQEQGRRSAGAASALGGGLPFLAGSLTLPLTGLLGTQTVLAMAGGMAAFFTVAAALAIATGTRLARTAPREA
jgi:MFS transporter, DHA1 family, multidrug resistance protein